MYRKLLASVREYKRPSIEAPLFVSLEVVMECIIPFIVAKLVNQIRVGCDFIIMLKYGVILVIMAFLSLTFGIIAGNACSTASCGFAKNLRSDLFRAVQKFSFENLDKFSTASLVTRLTTDVSGVQQAYMMIVRTAIRGPLMLVFSFVMALIMGGRIALIFLFTAPVLGLSLYFIARWSMPTFRKLFRKYDKLTNSIQENIRGVRVVKAFVREDYEKEKFSLGAKEICRDFTHADRILALNNPIMQFCLYVVMIFILYYGTYKVITSRGLDLNIGQISSLITYGTQILGSLMRLSMVLVMITLARESAARIVEVLDEKPALISPENGIKEILTGDIDFEDVSFVYRSAREINFSRNNESTQNFSASADYESQQNFSRENETQSQNFLTGNNESAQNISSSADYERQRSFSHENQTQSQNFLTGNNESTQNFSASADYERQQNFSHENQTQSQNFLTGNNESAQNFSASADYESQKSFSRENQTQSQNFLTGNNESAQNISASADYKSQKSFLRDNETQQQNKFYALKNINLHIDSGSTIGIIGGTGSSKTTLIQLIPRLYDATSGIIKISGQDVRKYDLESLRNNIAVVLQKNELFSGTIRENLLWGNNNATDSQIIEACKISCAYEFIEKLPEKFNTHIEQNGTNLSGGQKQRLCIARALLKQPKILILDDSTSAVDTHTDALIRSSLKKYLPNITKIIIAQRILSVQESDKIIVMDNGEIKAFDTHENLLKSNAVYKEIYLSQTREELL